MLLAPQMLEELSHTVGAQNQNSKIQTPKSKIISNQEIPNPGSCKVRLINVCFLKIWNNFKNALKKFARVPPRGAPCRQCTFSLFFFVLWYPKSKLRPPKSPPKACLLNSFFPKGSKIRTPLTNLTQKKR